MGRSGISLVFVVLAMLALRGNLAINPDEFNKALRRDCFCCPIPTLFTQTMRFASREGSKVPAAGQSASRLLV
ncbi:hypothetical protein V8F44DRAFT_609265 [Aspergillus fumigatus]